MIKMKKRVSKRGSLSRSRRWARRSLAQRFVTVESGLYPQKTRPAGLAYPGEQSPPREGSKVLEGSSSSGLRTRKPSALQRLVGNAKRSKLFVRALRRVLADGGVALVGPLPFALIERVWDRFGERLVSPHGPGCWCRLCVSGKVAHMSLVADLYATVVEYVRQMPLKTVLGFLLPAPLKTAKFVVNKLWQWLKVLAPGYTALLSYRVQQLFDSFCKWWKGVAGFPEEE